MSFLDKIKVHKNESADLPPPPPKLNKQAEPVAQEAPKTNPAPSPAPAASQPATFGSDSQSRANPTVPPVNTAPTPLSSAPSPAAPSIPPPLPSLRTSDSQEAPVSETPKVQSPPQSASHSPDVKKSVSREDLRKAFSDVAPIKNEAGNASLSDEVVDRFKVDSLRLPNEPEASPEPEPQIAESAETIIASGPLYLLVDKYQDIQTRLGDLREEVSTAHTDLDSIISRRESDDADLESFITQLEKIQQALIAIDEDLTQ